MEIEYKGANCIVVSRKKASFVVDPKLSQVGLKNYNSSASAVLATHHELSVDPQGDAVFVDGPGEYEINNCSIKGIAAKPHRSLKDGDMSATMYKIDLDDMSIAVVGHVDPNLSGEQLESLGVVDVLTIPIGGHGYTLDAKSAASLVKKIEPKIVIPTHFDDESLKFEVPQDTFEEFSKELGSEVESTSKVKLKAGQIPAGLLVYKLSISK